jgi:hypothetical protein
VGNVNLSQAFKSFGLVSLTALYSEEAMALPSSSSTGRECGAGLMRQRGRDVVGSGPERDVVGGVAGEPGGFFDDRTKAPRAVPRMLTRSERAAP